MRDDEKAQLEDFKWMAADFLLAIVLLFVTRPVLVFLGLPSGTAGIIALGLFVATIFSNPVQTFQKHGTPKAVLIDLGLGLVVAALVSALIPLPTLAELTSHSAQKLVRPKKPTETR